MPKLLALAAAAVLFIAMQSAHACSVSVGQVAMSNLMAAEAASHFGLSLAQVTQTTFGKYHKSFIGSDPETECPLRVQTSVRVVLKYRRKLAICQSTVTVIRGQQMFGEPDGPYETVDFASPVSACVL